MSPQRFRRLQVARSGWQITLGIFLILYSLPALGVAIPPLLLSVVALVAGVLVLVAR